MQYLSKRATKPTIRLVGPAKTKTSLRIHGLIRYFADRICLLQSQFSIVSGLTLSYELFRSFPGIWSNWLRLKLVLLKVFSPVIIIYTNNVFTILAGLGGSVGCASDKIRRTRVRTPPRRQHSFVEIDHEIFSTVILFLPLIQEGQLSVSGERLCTILVNRLED